jgi:hypothetical protein
MFCQIHGLLSAAWHKAETSKFGRGSYLNLCRLDMQIYIQDTPDNHISFQITAISFAEFAKSVLEVITTWSISYNKFHLQQITTYGKFKR